MKVIITEKIHNDGIKLLKKYMDIIYAYDLDQEKFMEICIEENVDAIVIRGIPYRVTKELIDKTPNLKGIAASVVEVSNIDTEYCKQKNIPVFNVPGGSSDAVAELAMGLIIGLARNIYAADYNVRYKNIYNKHLHVGVMLKDKTLGIISYGRIGKRLANFAKAFDMNIIAYDPYVLEGDTEEITLLKIEEVFKNSDFISVHTPLTPQTRNMITKDLFNLMKPTAFFVNTGRGGVVNEDDLVDALKNNKIAGAASDVFAVEPALNHPLFGLDNVICTPHIGGSTEESQKYLAQSSVSRLLNHLGYKVDLEEIV